MQNRDLAKLLGALSVEPRLLIIGGLIAAGDEGLTERDIADITGASASAIWLHPDLLVNAGLVTSRMNQVTKSYLANTALLRELFSFLNENYGAGLRPTKPTPGVSISVENESPED